jgi:hypothetical protein
MDKNNYIVWDNGWCMNLLVLVIAQVVVRVALQKYEIEST